MGLCSAWFVLTHHHHQIDTNSPFIRTHRERVSWHLFRLSFCLFFYWISWLSRVVFSNSHLSVLKERSPWVLPPFTWTSILPGNHENHLIWVYSRLIIFWVSFELLGLQKQGPAPLPDHLENHLIWVDLIKVILLGFVQYVLWAFSRTPNWSRLPCLVQLAVYVSFVPCTVHYTLYWLIAVICSVIDYVQLLSSLIPGILIP